VVKHYGIFSSNTWSWSAKAELAYSEISSCYSAAKNRYFVQKQENDCYETSKKVENKSIHIFIVDSRRALIFVDKTGVKRIKLKNK